MCVRTYTVSREFLNLLKNVNQDHWYTRKQLSTMIGIKDPTEPPKIEDTNQGNKQNGAVVKKSLINLHDFSMQTFLDLSKDMTETFRLMLDNLKVQFEQFREQNQSIFDLFSLSHLHKWIQREQ